jgi:hypothetical protein
VVRRAKSKAAKDRDIRGPLRCSSLRPCSHRQCAQPAGQSFNDERSYQLFKARRVYDDRFEARDSSRLEVSKRRREQIPGELYLAALSRSFSPLFFKLALPSCNPRFVVHATLSISRRHSPWTTVTAAAASSDTTTSRHRTCRHGPQPPAAAGGPLP